MVTSLFLFFHLSSFWCTLPSVDSSRFFFVPFHSNFGLPFFFVLAFSTLFKTTTISYPVPQFHSQSVISSLVNTWTIVLFPKYSSYKLPRICVSATVWHWWPYSRSALFPWGCFIVSLHPGSFLSASWTQSLPLDLVNVVEVFAVVPSLKEIL